VAASVRQLGEWSQAQLAEVGQIYEGAAHRLSGVLMSRKDLYTDPTFLVEIGERSLRKLQAQRRGLTLSQKYF
jgi:hypothetical protein